MDKLVIEANVDTSKSENAGIRQKWIDSVNEWINNKYGRSGTSNSIGRNSSSHIFTTSSNLPILQFDGACRGNPSNILGLGYIIKNSNKTETIEEGSYRFTTSSGTNNEAEYYALIKGMKLALDCNIKSIVIEGDSNLIINQMMGKYQVKAENLMPLYNSAKILEEQFDYIEYRHIKREFNKEADKLANKALDTDINTCSGCHPTFQENQMAHLGPDGCMNCN
jgi:ribonuclease HI